jgi:hypothetical protein
MLNRAATSCRSRPSATHNTADNRVYTVADGEPRVYLDNNMTVVQ